MGLIKSLPEKALLCEPGEILPVFQSHLYCPFCHKVWFNLSFVGMATDSYIVDEFGFIRRGFLSLDPQVSVCSCGIFWISDPEPFSFSIIAAEVHHEEKIQNIVDSRTIH
jgi:hypothetical protein